MYRKITSFLQAWKENEHRKPLILQGARQVGKTYSILEFGRTHYENVAYFNFETNPKLNETFEENISPDYLIPILSHIAGQTIVREKTLIVFDEVQLCERALTSLKYFCEDGWLSARTIWWSGSKNASTPIRRSRQPYTTPQCSSTVSILLSEVCRSA